MSLSFKSDDKILEMKNWGLLVEHVLNIRRDYIFWFFYFVVFNSSLVYIVLVNQNWNQTQPETRREKFRPGAVWNMNPQS